MRNPNFFLACSLHGAQAGAPKIVPTSRGNSFPMLDFVDRFDYSNKQMIRIRRILVLSALAALLLAAFQGRTAFENLKFHIGLFDKKGETEAVKAAVREYNGIGAAFYSTAADAIQGLDYIPASRLLKRRFFLDINQLKTEGLLMVFDRDREAVTNVSFLNRELAVVETEEVWAIALQKARTREMVFNVKAYESRGRYLLHKEEYNKMNDIWVVYQIDVYPKNEDIPKLDFEPAL